MRNVPEICIRETSESVIKFQEKRSSLRFSNENRKMYKCITVDGCAITEGERCDNALCSVDGRERLHLRLPLKFKRQSWSSKASSIPNF